MPAQSQPLRLDRADSGIYTVVSLVGRGSFCGRLEGMGVYPGAEIEVIGRPAGRPSGRGRSGGSLSRRGQSGRGPVDVAAGGSRFRLGRGMAARVLLESRRPGGDVAGEDARRRAVRKTPLTLRDYREGQKGRILELRGEGRFRKRLLEMGFVRGTEVYVEKYAPLLDPIEYVVKGYHVSLRRGEAEKVLMSDPEWD